MVWASPQATPPIFLPLNALISVSEGRLVVSPNPSAPSLLVPVAYTSLSVDKHKHSELGVSGLLTTLPCGAPHEKKGKGKALHSSS